MTKGIIFSKEHNEQGSNLNYWKIKFLQNGGNNLNQFKFSPYRGSYNTMFQGLCFLSGIPRLEGWC